MTNAYDIGDPVRLSCTLEDINGDLTDPLTVTFRVRDPSGEITDYTPTNDGVGLYHYDLTPPLDATSAGTWYWRVESTGFQSGEEMSFIVRPSKFY